LASPYLVAVGGSPPIGFDSGASSSASAGAKLKAPAESAAVAAAAASRRRSRKRRQQQTRKYDYADATLDYEVNPEWASPPDDDPVAAAVASDSGAGSLGFAGTVSKGSKQATGLATLANDDFGAGPSIPMLPHTWTPESRDFGDD
jgi:PPE-repeat protein